jgi:hypothetical protein
VLIVSWVVAAKVAFSSGTDTERALRAQAQKTVTARARSKAAYRKSAVWGFLTEPKLGSSKHRGLGLEILAGTLSVLALVFLFAGRVR